MKKTILIIITVVLAAGLLTACGAFGSNPTGSANQPPQRTLNVTGSGKVNLTPDIVYINIGVHTEGADVAEALASNTAQAQKVTDALKQYNVEAKDIQTTAFNVYPQQQYGPQGEMLDIKYMVDNSVYVTVRDLTNLGAILDTVVKSGANNINGIQFDVANRDAAISEARKAAVADARAQAEELVAAAGAKLGEVQFINVSSYTQPIGPTSLKGDGGLAASSNVPVSAGQIQISVDVNVTYNLK
jgi:uncharacterized protein